MDIRGGETSLSCLKTSTAAPFRLAFFINVKEDSEDYQQSVNYSSEANNSMINGSMQAGRRELPSILS